MVTLSAQLEKKHHVTPSTQGEFADTVFVCIQRSLTEAITLIPFSPRAPDLLVFTFLQCEIQPPNAMVDVGWRLPSGEFLTPDNDTVEFHVSDVGSSIQADNTTEAVIILTIFGLSYQHAGSYACEVRDTTTAGAEWITAEVDLQLRGTDYNNVSITIIMLVFQL